MGLQVERIRAAVPSAVIGAVVGYMRDDISRAMPDMRLVVNPRFDRENTSKSLLRALREIGDGDDLLWLNGDVALGPGVIESVVGVGTSCMAVNIGPVADEEVRYRTDGHRRILEVSKTVRRAEGEALGVNLFKAADLLALRAGLEACADNDYFERGIELCIRDGLAVRAVDVSGLDCVEIDFPEDLERANGIVLGWE
jgi:choline kinase